MKKDISLTQKEIQVMVHATKWDKVKNKQGNRNHFCAGKSDEETWEGLETIGLAVRRDDVTIPMCGVPYSVSEKGIEFLTKIFIN